jgi:hypothetical protein
VIVIWRTEHARRNEEWGKRDDEFEIVLDLGSEDG